MFKRITQALGRVYGSIASRLSVSSDSFMYATLCILVVLGPLFFIPGFTSPMSKGFFVFFAGVLCLLAYGVQVLRRGVISLPKQKIFLVAALISGIGLLGSFFSESFKFSFFGYGFETTTWLFVTLVCLLVFFSYHVVKSYDRVGILYTGMIGSFVILTIFHIIRYIAGPEVLRLGVLGGTTDTIIGTWADLGIFFGMIALLCTITLELAGLKRSFKCIVAGMGVLALVALIFINIGTVWIVVGLVALLFALYSFSFAYWDRTAKTYRKDNRVPVYTLGLFFIAVICIFFGGFFSNLANRHQNITWNDVRPSLVTTFRVAGKSLADNFATGYGPNMFAEGWSLVKPPALSGSSAANTEFNLGYGYVPTHLATQGILGVIVWIGFFVLLAIALVRRMGRGFDSAIDRYFTISLGVLIVYLSILSWVYVPGAYNLALLAVIIGSFLSVAPDPHPIKDASYSFIKDPRASFFGILGITVMLVATIFGGYIGIKKLISFVHYAQGQKLLAQSNFQGANREVSVAAVLAPHDVFHTTLSNFALSDAGTIAINSTEENRQAVAKQVEQTLGLALGHARAAIKMNDASYKNWLVLGNVYRFMVTLGINGAYEEALAAYQTAEKRNPNDTTMRLYFAQLEVAKKDQKKALELIAESINRYPTKDAYVLRAQIELAQNDPQAALTSMGAAVALNPYNADLVYQYGLLLFSQKQYSNAIVAFQRVVTLNRAHGPAYVYLGVSYEYSGDLERANKVYAYLRTQTDNADQAIQAVKSGNTETPAPETTNTTTSPASKIPPTVTKPVAPSVKK